MKDGTKFDVNKVKEATTGAGGNIYNFSGRDFVNINLLKYSLTSLHDVYVPENIFSKLDSDYSDDALPIIETGESIYLVFKSSWYADFENKNIKGLDVTGTNTITLPIKQYTAS